MKERHLNCEKLRDELLQNRKLIIGSNRGPVTLQFKEDGSVEFQRGGGGLVTALIGLAQHIEATWVAVAMTDADQAWREGPVPLEDGEGTIDVKFVIASDEMYDQYYNVIANPLLWFLQHSMYDNIRSPTINYSTWQAWENGYVVMNRLFAETIANQIELSRKRPLVMLQDYHLYLVPYFLRRVFRPHKSYTLTHFVHIPWPGTEGLGMLPPKMRGFILESLCSVDLLGFQTREDALNFIRNRESYLPGAHVNYRHGRVWYRHHATHVRDFPISIDVEAINKFAKSEEVVEYRQEIEERFGEYDLIVRVDRIEPSKNIVRGFEAFDELLELYPEHIENVVFLAYLVPSRMEVEEYQNYLDELMAAAGRVNARHGTSEWEPVRILVGENYPRAVAALEIYDVLLVNSIADGMNLVAKEGPSVNQHHGTVILSERTGARQQLESGAIVISPTDVYATAEAMHQALVMPEDERRQHDSRLKLLIEQEDIVDWLCRQLETIAELNL